MSARNIVVINEAVSSAPSQPEENVTRNINPIKINKTKYVGPVFIISPEITFNETSGNLLGSEKKGKKFFLPLKKKVKYDTKSLQSTPFPFLLGCKL